MRKLKLHSVLILNVVLIISFFVFFIFPYKIGEKIYHNISCTEDLVREIRVYKNRNGNFPTTLDLIETSLCVSKADIKYKFLHKEEYNERLKRNKNNVSEYDLLKEDSFILILDIHELRPNLIKFYGHKDEPYSDDKNVDSFLYQ